MHLSLFVGQETTNPLMMAYITAWSKRKGTWYFLPMQPLPNTQRYRISYQANGDHPLIQYSTTTTSQQTGLVLGVNYSITVSASMDLTRYRGGNCYSRYLYGKDSDPVYVVTQERCMLNHVLHKYINKRCVLWYK